MKFVTLIILALCLVVPVTATAAPVARTSSTYTVQDENLALRRYIARQNVVIRSLRHQNTDLRYKLYVAQAGLPTAIKGVAKVDFLRLVLLPAAEVWPCDGYSTTPTTWTFTFTSC